MSHGQIEQIEHKLTMYMCTFKNGGAAYRVSRQTVALQHADPG